MALNNQSDTWSEQSVLEHIEWADNLNSRLDNIYKELCYYEEQINDKSDDDFVKLMELLENLNDIHKVAQKLRPLGIEFKQKHQDMHDQMEILQNSVKLLSLESPSQSINE